MENLDELTYNYCELWGSTGPESTLGLDHSYVFHLLGYLAEDLKFKNLIDRCLHDSCDNWQHIVIAPLVKLVFTILLLFLLFTGPFFVFTRYKRYKRRQLLRFFEDVEIDDEVHGGQDRRSRRGRKRGRLSTSTPLRTNGPEGFESKAFDIKLKSRDGDRLADGDRDEFGYDLDEAPAGTARGHRSFSPTKKLPILSSRKGTLKRSFSWMSDESLITPLSTPQAAQAFGRSSLDDPQRPAIVGSTDAAANGFPESTPLSSPSTSPTTPLPVLKREPHQNFWRVHPWRSSGVDFDDGPSSTPSTTPAGWQRPSFSRFLSFLLLLIASSFLFLFAVPQVPAPACFLPTCALFNILNRLNLASWDGELDEDTGQHWRFAGVLHFPSSVNLITKLVNRIIDKPLLTSDTLRSTTYIAFQSNFAPILTTGKNLFDTLYAPPTTFYQSSANQSTLDSVKSGRNLPREVFLPSDEAQGFRLHHELLANLWLNDPANGFDIAKIYQHQLGVLSTLGRLDIPSNLTVDESLVSLARELEVYVDKTLRDVYTHLENVEDTLVKTARRINESPVFTVMLVYIPYIIASFPLLFIGTHILGLKWSHCYSDPELDSNPHFDPRSVSRGTLSAVDAIDTRQGVSSATETAENDEGLRQRNNQDTIQNCALDNSLSVVQSASPASSLTSSLPVVATSHRRKSLMSSLSKGPSSLSLIRVMNSFVMRPVAWLLFGLLALSSFLLFYVLIVASRACHSLNSYIHDNGLEYEDDDLAPHTRQTSGKYGVPQTKGEEEGGSEGGGGGGGLENVKGKIGEHADGWKSSLEESSKELSQTSGPQLVMNFLNQCVARAGSGNLYTFLGLQDHIAAWSAQVESYRQNMQSLVAPAEHLFNWTPDPQVSPKLIAEARLLAPQMHLVLPSTRAHPIYLFTDPRLVFATHIDSPRNATKRSTDSSTLDAGSKRDQILLKLYQQASKRKLNDNMQANGGGLPVRKHERRQLLNASEALHSENGRSKQDIEIFNEYLLQTYGAFLPTPTSSDLGTPKSQLVWPLASFARNFNKLFNCQDTFLFCPAFDPECAERIRDEMFESGDDDEEEAGETSTAKEGEDPSPSGVERFAAQSEDPSDRLGDSVGEGDNGGRQGSVFIRHERRTVVILEARSFAHNLNFAEDLATMLLGGRIDSALSSSETRVSPAAEEARDSSDRDLAVFVERLLRPDKHGAHNALDFCLSTVRDRYAKLRALVGVQQLVLKDLIFSPTPYAVFERDLSNYQTVFLQDDPDLESGDDSSSQATDQASRRRLQSSDAASTNAALTSSPSLASGPFLTMLSSLSTNSSLTMGTFSSSPNSSESTLSSSSTASTSASVGASDTPESSTSYMSGNSTSEAAETASSGEVSPDDPGPFVMFEPMDELCMAGSSCALFVGFDAAPSELSKGTYHSAFKVREGSAKTGTRRRLQEGDGSAEDDKEEGDDGRRLLRHVDRLTFSENIGQWMDQALTRDKEDLAYFTIDGTTRLPTPFVLWEAILGMPANYDCQQASRLLDYVNESMCQEFAARITPAVLVWFYTACALVFFLRLERSMRPVRRPKALHTSTIEPALGTRTSP